MSNCGDEELFRYVGTSSLKRRQFVERRTHIFRLTQDDAIALQVPKQRCSTNQITNVLAELRSLHLRVPSGFVPSASWRCHFDWSSVGVLHFGWNAYRNPRMSWNRHWKQGNGRSQRVPQPDPVSPMGVRSLPQPRVRVGSQKPASLRLPGIHQEGMHYCNWEQMTKCLPIIVWVFGIPIPFRGHFAQHFSEFFQIFGDWNLFNFT